MAFGLTTLPGVAPQSGPSVDTGPGVVDAVEVAGHGGPLAARGAALDHSRLWLGLRAARRESERPREAARAARRFSGAGALGLAGGPEVRPHAPHVPSKPVTCQLAASKWLHDNGRMVRPKAAAQAPAPSPRGPGAPRPLAATTESDPTNTRPIAAPSTHADVFGR